MIYTEAMLEIQKNNLTAVECKLEMLKERYEFLIKKNNGKQLQTVINKMRELEIEKRSLQRKISETKRELGIIKKPKRAENLTVKEIEEAIETRRRMINSKKITNKELTKEEINEKITNINEELLKWMDEYNSLEETGKLYLEIKENDKVIETLSTYDIVNKINALVTERTKLETKLAAQNLREKWSSESKSSLEIAKEEKEVSLQEIKEAVLETEEKETIDDVESKKEPEVKTTETKVEKLENKNGKTNNTKKSTNAEIKSFKFNGATGEYVLEFCVDGDKVIRKTHMIDRTLLDINFEETQDLMEKYGDKDLNVELFLRSIDINFKTNFQEKYNNNEIGVEYNLKNLSSVNFLTRKDRKLIKENAKRYECLNENSKVLKDNSGFKKMAATAAVVALSVASIFGFNAKKDSKKDSKETSKTIEVNNQAQDETTISNVLYEDETTRVVEPEIETTSLPEVETISNSDLIELLNNVKTEIVTAKENKNIENVAIEETNHVDILVGDNVHLENADLYYSSVADKPSGNTTNLDNKDFIINGIAVTSNDGIIDVKWEGNVDEVVSKYGSDCNYYINIVDSNLGQIGWVKYDNIKTTLENNALTLRK